MKVKINNTEFEIKEVSQDEMKKWYIEDEGNKGYYYGQTHFMTQEIWLDGSLSLEKKKKTLYHELMHCYIREYLTGCDLQYDEELLCDISANSHDMIHRIVEEYFSPKLIIQQPDIKLTPEMLESMQSDVVLYANDVNTTVTRRKSK